VLSFANEARLDEHWRKHGLNAKEFRQPFSKQQYLDSARAFFASKAKDIETKRDRDGDTLRYRISTNEFGVLSSRNVIRTYFRPDSGIRYWRRQ
jgi:pyocin large subunit-like protein